jgi:hypothetical protein
VATTQHGHRAIAQLEHHEFFLVLAVGMEHQVAVADGHAHGVIVQLAMPSLAPQARQYLVKSGHRHNATPRGNVGK